MLVGLEVASGDDEVLAHAVVLARRHGARLTLLWAMRSVHWCWVPWLGPIPSEDPMRAAKRECLACVRAALRDLPSDVSLVTMVKAGSPAAVLRSEARRHHYDLIVVGERSRRFGRSTASALRRSGDMPVLAVPRPRSAPVGRSSGAPTAAPEPGWAGRT